MAQPTGAELLQNTGTVFVQKVTANLNRIVAVCQIGFGLNSCSFGELSGFLSVEQLGCPDSRPEQRHHQKSCQTSTVP